MVPFYVSDVLFYTLSKHSWACFLFSWCPDFYTFSIMVWIWCLVCSLHFILVKNLHFWWYIFFSGYYQNEFGTFICIEILQQQEVYLVNYSTMHAMHRYIIVPNTQWCAYTCTHYNLLCKNSLKLHLNSVCWLNVVLYSFVKFTSVAVLCFSEYGWPMLVMTCCCRWSTAGGMYVLYLALL
jgi:hypothetical protein